jgi:hypothetical protein
MPTRLPVALTPSDSTQGFDFTCFYCGGVALRPGKAIIPSCLTFREAHCPSCGGIFICHLPVGYGDKLGAALDQRTGQARSIQRSVWFLERLERAWGKKEKRKVRLTRESFAPLRRPLLVNCMDSMYGHCLQLMFTIPTLRQEYPDRDIIVLVQDFARWMVPDGVAEIWSADLSLREGSLWFDDLALQIDERLASLPPVETAGFFGLERPDIAKFTRAAAFDYASVASLRQSVVSLVWREDRCWTAVPPTRPEAEAAEEQAELMTVLAETVRAGIPELDIAVVGIGSRGRFPSWITDLRVSSGARIDEHAWLQRYAKSHVVIGVHGSNMLLPSAHAATAIELVPRNKWQHVGDTYDFVRARDGLTALRQIRFLPLSIDVEELALITRVQIRQAKMGSFWRQEYGLPEDQRAALRAAFGHVFAYLD